MKEIDGKYDVSDDGCWIWNRSCNSAGYGQITINKKYWLAHRYVFYKTNGFIDDDSVIRHICHNTKCCNPSHLLIGSQKENWLDSKEIHSNSKKRYRKGWNILGKYYTTCRDASNKTGLSFGTLIKYTCKDTRIFDYAAYLSGCEVARVSPVTEESISKHLSFGWKEVKWIRSNFRLWKDDSPTIDEISRKFKIPKSKVYSIILGEIWQEPRENTRIIKYSGEIAERVFNR